MVDLGTDIVRREGCPVCGGAEREVAHLFPPFAVAKCGQCRMMYADPMAGPEKLDAYYDMSFGSGVLRDGQALAAGVACRALLRLVKRRELGRILDVGCGYGFLLSELARRGVAGVGVEPSMQSVSFACDELGVDVRPGRLADAGLEPGTFDTVVMMEVVEHLADPRILLAEAASMLRPGGRLVVGTDNFVAPAVRRAGRAWPKWLPHLHLSHFNPDALRDVLKQVGLRCEAGIGYTPWECHVMMARRTLFGEADPAVDSGWLDRALARDGQGRIRGRRLRGMVNPIWFALTASRRMRGSMMYVVARRDTSS